MNLVSLKCDIHLLLSRVHGGFGRCIVEENAL